MKKLAAVFLALHGLAHLVGVTVAWRIMEPEAGYPTALLGGRWEVGTGVIYAGGAFWLLGAVAFLVAGYALFLRRPWFGLAAAPAAAYSLALSAVYWPDARIGVYLNAAILVVLAAARLRARPVVRRQAHGLG